MNHVSALNPPFVFRHKSTLKLRITLRAFWILSILLGIAFLVSYIFQVNAEVSERYLIQQYERGINELAIENQNLEINSVQINSLDNIATLIEELNFEKIDKIHYIRVLDDQMVTR